MWYPETRALLCSLYGAEAFARLEAALLTPPSTTCVRVNTLAASAEEVRAVLEELAGAGTVVSCAADGLPEALLVRGAGQRPVDLSLACGREVAVNRRCAEAVLRGADVFVPGVLGCSVGVEEGMLVAVTAVVEPLGASFAGMTRGTRLPLFTSPPPRLLLGCGCASVAPTVSSYR